MSRRRAPTIPLQNRKTKPNSIPQTRRQTRVDDAVPLQNRKTKPNSILQTRRRIETRVDDAVPLQNRKTNPNSILQTRRRIETRVDDAVPSSKKQRTNRIPQTRRRIETRVDDDDDDDDDDGNKKPAAVDSNNDNDNNNNVEELPDDTADDDEPNNTDTLLPLSHYVRKKTSGIPLLNHVVEIKLANTIELLLQQLIEKGDALTRVAAKDLILDMKTKNRASPFGLNSAKQKSFLDNNKSSLWDLVMLDEEVIAAVALDSRKLNSDWWKQRVAHSFPWKSCNRGNPNLNRIGGFLAATRNGYADDADRNNFGINMDFGENTKLYVTTLEAMRKGDKTVVPDIFGGFNKEEAYNLAYEKVKSLLDILAKEKNITVANILNGKDLHQFLIDYRSDFEALETKAREDGIALANLYELDLVDDKRYIDPFIGIRFLTAINIFCTFDDIVAGLKDQTLCALRDVDNQLRFLCKVDEKMTVQYCIGGGCVQQGLDADNYERDFFTDGYYMMEQYSASPEFKNFLLLHMDADKSYEGRTSNKSNLKITIPETNRFIRKVSINFDLEQMGFTCTLKTGISTPDKKMKIHRLLKIVEEHYERGIHFYQPLRKYLGLKGGDTFQVVDRFKCECDTSEAGLKALKTRFKHLKVKGWLHVSTATVCDVDHTVGRSKFWMNSNMLLLTCSHQYNTQLSIIRSLFGDWGFAFSRMKYGTGKD